MKIDQAWLVKEGACGEARRRFNDVFNGKPTEHRAVLDALIKDDELSWASWLIIRVMAREQCALLAQYASECADSVVRQSDGHAAIAAAHLSARFATKSAEVSWLAVEYVTHAVLYAAKSAELAVTSTDHITARREMMCNVLIYGLGLLDAAEGK